MPTTHNTTYPGLGILADNQDIYANSRDYYADGAVVMRDTKGTISLLCSDTDVLCRDLRQICSDITVLIYDKAGHGLDLRCNDRVVLCNARNRDALGASTFNNISY